MIATDLAKRWHKNGDILTSQWNHPPSDQRRHTVQEWDLT